ncbi:MAG: hypothetical protein MK291_07600 [Planctomycetes bacterium]|nr:hypothetical protein [Planctomycetota bacterium]
MTSPKSNARDRRALSLTGIGCLIVAGAASLLTNQADATPVALTPIAPEASPLAVAALPEALEREVSQRAQALAKPDEIEAEVSAPETQAREETISYSYELTRERSNDEPLLLKTSGSLTLFLSADADGTRRADARLQNVVAWDAEGVDAVFLAEVMGTSASVSLSPAGAILEVELPEGLSPEAVRYWKRVLGRWQTAGPAKPEYAERWRATERNEFGNYSALYEPDAESGDGTIRKIVLGYTSLEDVEVSGPPMCESEIRITPGEHPTKIEGRELLRSGLSLFGPEELLTYSYTRTR